LCYTPITSYYYVESMSILIIEHFTSPAHADDHCNVKRFAVDDAFFHISLHLPMDLGTVRTQRSLAREAYTRPVDLLGSSI
jgi:hypothetical protein